jgi:hypothetical protein
LSGATSRGGAASGFLLKRGCRKSADCPKSCRGLDLKPTRNKQYTRKTNGKAAPFFKTLLRELDYRMSFKQLANDGNQKHKPLHKKRPKPISQP